MPDRDDGAHVLRAVWLLSAGSLAVMLSHCAVYDAGLVDPSRDGGAAFKGSGGGPGSTPVVGTGGQVDGGFNGIIDGSSVFPTAPDAAVTTGGGDGGGGGAGSGDPSTGGSSGAGGSGGAGGSPGTGGGGASGAGGGAGGGCPVGGANDLTVFSNGTFVSGWGTVGSWNTCNGTPINATVNATTALAVDLSCNSFNGALVVNWSAPVSCVYSNLSFDLYFNNLSDISALQVYLQNGQGKVGLLINVTTLIATPQAKAFNHVSVPFTAFGTSLVFNGVGFFNGSGAGLPLFYLNNVVLAVGSPPDASTD
jgi:hypothetical protein